MYFELLQKRLLAALQDRLRNGELTERRLAQITGISQPHIHNVLNGNRVLSLRATDQIMKRLKLTVSDICNLRQTGACCTHCAAGSSTHVPLVEGKLGPGLKVPFQLSPVESFPFPTSLVTGLHLPVAARLALDPAIEGFFQENDLALLDQSPSRRLKLRPDGFYVVCLRGEAVVRRAYPAEGDRLLLTSPSGGPAAAEAVPLAGRRLLDVVVAEIVWLGRFLKGG